MKLSELRPCDSCGGPLEGRQSPYSSFSVVRVSQAMLDRRDIQMAMGSAAIMGGMRALPIAEAMGAGGNDVVLIFGEKDKNLWTELLICFDCTVNPRHCLAELVEARVKAKESAKK